MTSEADYEMACKWFRDNPDRADALIAQAGYSVSSLCAATIINYLANNTEVPIDDEIRCAHGVRLSGGDCVRCAVVSNEAWSAELEYLRGVLRAETAARTDALVASEGWELRARQFRLAGDGLNAAVDAIVGEGEASEVTRGLDRAQDRWESVCAAFDKEDQR